MDLRNANERERRLEVGTSTREMILSNMKSGSFCPFVNGVVGLRCSGKGGGGPEYRGSYLNLGEIAMHQK